MSKHRKSHTGLDDEYKAEEDLRFPRHEGTMLTDNRADFLAQPQGHNGESTHADVLDGEHSLLRDSSADSELSAPIETLMHPGHRSQSLFHSGAFSSDILNMTGARQGPRSGGDSSNNNSSGGGSGLSGAGTGPVAKERTFRCRHCSFQVQNKVEFWRHARTHIKPEKMLQCKYDKCEFVTEYRHHLVYHELNHGNVKPFQCDKCSYRCVNRSMLNSHLKSHSSMCHYRCQDCSYATKYCHSLKTHLRKNGHRPAGATAHGLSTASKQSHHLRHSQLQQQHHQQQQSLSSTHLLSTKPPHMLSPLPFSSQAQQHAPQHAPQAQPQPPQSLLLPPPACLPWPPHQLLLGAVAANGDSNYLLCLRRQAAMAAAAAAAAAAFRQSSTSSSLPPLAPPPFFFSGAGSSTSSELQPLVFPPPPTISPLPALPPLPFAPPSTSMPLASWHHHQYHQHLQQLQSHLPPPTPPMPFPQVLPPASMHKSRQAPASELATPSQSATPATMPASAPLDLRVSKPKLAVL